MSSRPAIAAARAHPGPAIIEFRVVREENVFPMVLSGASLAEVIPDTPYVPARRRHPDPGGRARRLRPHPTPVHAQEGSLMKHTLVATMEDGPAA